MKKTLILSILSLASAFFCVSVFAAGGIELQITNRTRAQINEIMITDIKTNENRIVPVVLANNEIATIKLRKDFYYNIKLIDINRHQYGILNRRWNAKTNQIQISHYDFIHQSIPDTARRIIGR